MTQIVVDSKKVKQQIEDLLRAGPVSSTGIAERLGISRQAAHYHLRKKLESGEIEKIGSVRGPGTLYANPSDYQIALPLHGLDESEVWREVASELQSRQPFGGSDLRIHQYVFTEMLNNAIDHSGSETVDVSAQLHDRHLEFSIRDYGIGVFESIRAAAGFADPSLSILELTKGKFTTDPENHTGEGIFFSSKTVDSFLLASNGWAFDVDNIRSDFAISSSPVTEGTKVTWHLAVETNRSLSEVFDRYADEESFRRTRPIIKLAGIDETFVSRSEAKRLSTRLEQFSEVELDFSGVESVGQGFVDELFRVWANLHPGVALIPVNMKPAVSTMVRRVRAPERDS